MVVPNITLGVIYSELSYAFKIVLRMNHTLGRSLNDKEGIFFVNLATSERLMEAIIERMLAGRDL